MPGPQRCMDRAPGVERRQSQLFPGGRAAMWDLPGPRACVGRWCVSMTHLHPWRQPECWVHGLLNTRLTAENGTDAPSWGNHPGSHLASLPIRVSPSQPCCSEALPSPGTAGPGKGPAVAARLREKASCDNEPLLTTGRPGGRGPRGANESVGICLSRSAPPGR